MHFPHLEAAYAYLQVLQTLGLQHRGADGNAVDLVLVDQLHGPLLPCEWLKFGRSFWDNNPHQTVVACWELPSSMQQIVTPLGWSYATSISAGCDYLVNGNLPPRLEYVLLANGASVLRDQENGREYPLSAPD